MKMILALIILCLSWFNTAVALPNCIGESTFEWTMCEAKKIFSSGAEYIGEWKDGKRDGKGTFIYPDEKKYVGSWIKGKRDSKGTFTYPDGSKYIGEWMKSERHGYGTLIKKNGSEKKVGQFKNGKFIE